MYKTDIDFQLLKKNIKPWGKSQKTSWRLYELNEHKPGYKKHGNMWKHFQKHGVTQERLVDWDIPPIVGNGATFGLQQQLNSARPSVRYLREMNIYDDTNLKSNVTNDYIVKNTDDKHLARDVHSAIKDFLGPLGWEEVRFSRFQQPSGEVTLAHIDAHRQFCNMYDSLEDPVLCGEIKIGVMFLEDWAYGQGFGMGKDVVQNWKMGDFYEWPWFFPHHTYNNSNVERNSLTFVGRKRLRDRQS